MSLLRSGVVLVTTVLILPGCIANSLIPARFRAQPAVQPHETTASTRSRDTGNMAPSDDAVAAGTEQALPAGEARVVRVASAQATQDIGRADLLGGWKVTSGNDNCQLFMSLTGWAGGYRAVTKGCSSPVLADVQAWTLNGEEIDLLSGRGDTIVRLRAAEKTRLNGETDRGQGVIVFR